MSHQHTFPSLSDGSQQPNPEKMKKTIMDDLFKEINRQNCVIDLLLQTSHKKEEMKANLSQESIDFYTHCENLLRTEYESGNILFFRKNKYEIILNKYLSRFHGLKHPEMELFPSKQKQQQEAKKLETERKRNERIMQEKQILQSIHDLNLYWEKKNGVNKSYYISIFDGKQVEFYTTTDTRKKVEHMTFELKYNNEDFSYVTYDGYKILEYIENTHPKTVKNNNIVHLMNKQYLNQTKKSIKNIVPKDPEELKRIQKREERKQRQKEAAQKTIQKRLQRKLAKKMEEEKRKEDEAKRIKEEKKLLEQRKQEELQSLPQITVKDFVVKRTVFKCRHQNHDINDLDAAVTVIRDDGKPYLVKISAGYCRQCNTYFILESTYNRLRNLGVILCRISDEKAYLNNSYANEMHLAQESILMQFGYTVSQNENLSPTQRRKILAVMIDNHIITRSEIISYLDLFINQRYSQSKFELAISKWESDRDFVMEYNVGHYTQYGVNAIYRR